jgi:hypothetical protein
MLCFTIANTHTSEHLPSTNNPKIADVYGCLFGIDRCRLRRLFAVKATSVVIDGGVGVALIEL